MTHLPIIFSAPMVRAILNTKPDVWPAEPIDPDLPFKWMTRRIAKFAPLHEGLSLSASSLHAGSYFTGHPETGWVLRSMGGACWNDRTKPLHCPYGKPGDLLWVREGLVLDGDPWRYRADNATVMVEPQDETAMIIWAHHKQQDYCSPVHMPRWASRLTLEIAGVRVERVQDITEEDARAEGMRAADLATGKECILSPELGSYRLHFKSTWESIHGRDSLGANPWVWVITFKRLSQGESRRMAEA